MWEPPKEGYVSLEDTKPKNQEEPEMKSKGKKGKTDKKSGDSDSKKLKKKEPNVSKEVKEKPKPSVETYGPMPSSNPYGNWESTFQ